jgi:hypothetical protein
MEDPIKKLHKLDKLADAVIVTFEITSFERNANRNKKPLPGMSKFVNRLSKCNRTASVSLLLHPLQRKKARLRGPLPSRKNGGRSE